MDTYTDLTKKIYLTNPVTGTSKLMSSAVASNAGIERVLESKDSVDDGFFTPGEFRVNPYSVSRVASDGYVDAIIHERVLSPTSVIEYHFTGRFLSQSAHLEYMRAVEPERVRELAKLAYQRALAKVGGAELEGLTELGELKETVQLLKNPLHSLLKVLSKDRGRLAVRLARALSNPKDFLRSAKINGSAAADTWMEVRYGIRPLVNTISDIAEVIEKVLQKASVNRIYRKRSRNFVAYTDTFDKIRNAPGGTFDTTANITVSKTYKIQGVCHYRRVWDQSLDEALGLTPQLIPETVWELTRLSFVVDWIFGLGPWLSTLRIRPGIEVLGGCYSVKTEARSSCTGTLFLYTGMDLAVNQTGLDTTSFQRFTDLTDANKRPIFRGSTGLDWLKLVDTVILSHQAISALLKKR